MREKTINDEAVFGFDYTVRTMNPDVNLKDMQNEHHFMVIQMQSAMFRIGMETGNPLHKYNDNLYQLAFWWHDTNNYDNEIRYNFLIKPEDRCIEVEVMQGGKVTQEYDVTVRGEIVGKGFPGGERYTNVFYSTDKGERHANLFDLKDLLSKAVLIHKYKLKGFGIEETMDDEIISGMSI